MLNYLRDSCGPKDGYGARTALWGLQRPPLDGRVTVLRVEKEGTVDDLAAKMVVFAATNAKSQVLVSVEEGNEDGGVIEAAKEANVDVVVEGAGDWESR